MVHSYVLQHYHWRPADFYIQREPDVGGCHVYYVINRDDEERHYNKQGVQVFVTGVGKSFQVYVDPRRNVVVHEMRFG